MSSLDSSEASPPPVHRDWFFPSAAPFLPATTPARSRTLINPRKPSSAFPSTSGRAASASKSFFRDARPQRSSFSSSAATSSPPTSAAPPIRRRDPRYAAVKRKVCFDTPSTLADKRKPDGVESCRDDRTTGVRGGGVLGGGSRARIGRPAAALSVFIIACFSSLLHKNFSLHGQVGNLQDQMLMLNRRLQACALYDHLDVVSVTSQADEHMSNKHLKNSALFFSVTMLSIPLIILKYIDRISRLRSSDTEGVSLNKQLAYRVDLFLSVHPYAKPSALLLATLMLICLGGLALYGVTDDVLADCLWLSWTFVADSGNHANSVGIGPKLVSVSISFGGMLIFAMMLGLVSDAISEKFDSLRKGRSEVIEKNHTLILGWSDKLGSLLNQLAIANESLGGGTVVVMAERDKEEMELDIAKMEFDFKGTSVICRSGSPLILADLKKVSVSKARAVVVLAEDGNADQSDARALRTVLSLTGVKEGLRGHIVVELSDLDNEVLVKLVGGDLVETVVAHDVIGRLMIQCARQPGLAQIWEDILGFENCEFYIKRWPQLDGMPFEDVLISFPDAVPCGVKVASSGGKIILNPDDSYVLQEGDEVLVIAEDDDTYSPSILPVVHEAVYIDIVRPARKPQKILLCGWRRDIDDMIVVSYSF
ncbi:CASTOR/POLLUX/SYM8 ion channels protein [Dioscorea alata]|uniref:CASTOR/POLLUX/SYM8 ion channels protein n=1 Tax=Dioscorea alata TaxID=55571 RepID=A0ACB7WAL5_DIOAL|nr:CASTOR/POLLUX/SYM8 ion channels protein [Dioscorea alata]